MVEHTPLTSAQRALRAEIEKAGHVDLTERERHAPGSKWNDLLFLGQAGYLKSETIYVGQDGADAVLRWSSSGAPAAARLEQERYRAGGKGRQQQEADYGRFYV